MADVPGAPSPTRDAFGAVIDWPADLGGNPFEDESEVPATPDAAATPDQPVAEPEPQATHPQLAPADTATPAEPATPAADQAAPAPEPVADATTQVAPGEEVFVPPENDPFAAFRDEKGLIFSKYKTGEDWAAGHENLDRFATEQSMARAQVQREAEQMRQLLIQAQDLISKQNGQPAPAPAAAPVVPPDLDMTDPDAAAQWLAQQRIEMQQQLETQMQQQMQEQFQTQQQQLNQNQLVQDQMSAVQRFRSRFTDAAPGSTVDREVARIFQEYRADVPQFERYTDETLEVAYTLAKNPLVKQTIDRFGLEPNIDAVRRAGEIVADPQLARYVAAHPDTITADDQGWQEVKGYANLPALLQGTVDGAAANQLQQQDQQRLLAHVETNSASGAPVQAAPGDRPQTDNELFVAEVVNAWREQSSQFTRGTS